ncbi:hypothetical protein AOC05_05330 [Arthrobacter alpinus]|uniref:Uncharacterized protein n=1 Tax=Arthrobacter alpinus TaxID=656366 RepID=A0A0M3UFZ7_9MICC|nr:MULTISPECIES: hypothetical protein [Arthrobacter]ALE91889.1 hypothetical protein AOC05_05330 [Arthrobacter alpinus]
MSQTQQITDSTADANIVRLYKTGEDGVLVFREAWVDAEDGSEGGAGEQEIHFVLNHGPVGQQSTSKDTLVATEEEARGLLAGFAAQCLEDGYVDLAREEQFSVVAQFAMKNDRVTDRDKYLEEKAREALIAHLAWRGSGVVEKTEFVAGAHGTGKLNIYILAPDAARAVANIKVCIREEKLDFTKLSIGVAPANDLAAIKGKFTPTGTTVFAL